MGLPGRLLCAIVLTTCAGAAPPATAERFSFEARAGKLQSGHWRVAGLPRKYFSELLPAIFERTLIIERFQSRSGALDWIFTGELGGFTVHAGNGQIRVAQRYYDSYGFADLAHPARHPEKEVSGSTAAIEGDLHAITVRLDAKLGLTVLLNGKEVIRQHCLLDVSRHQLGWSGGDGTTSGYLEPPRSSSAVIEVDPSKRRQTMLGFGGITTPAAYAQLSREGKRQWWQILAEYNFLLHREYPMGARLNPAMDNWDRLSDAMPHYYGDNFPNGEVSDFSYLKGIRRLGGKVLFEFWALPAWARKDEAADPGPYARAMVRYCELARDRTGAPPEIVGIQNEVSQTPAVWKEMTLRLRAALDEAGFGRVRIHMRDDGRLAGGIACARAFRGFPEVWSAIDYSATHLYDYQKYFYDPDGFDPLLKQWREVAAGKPFLSTELSVNNSEFQARSYRLALSMGQLYHKNLALADASALLYCWLLLNVEQPSYGWTRTLFVPSPTKGFVPEASSYQARVFGAYSRRIRAGMTRVEAASSNPDLFVTAFTGADGSRTLVVLNRSLQDQKITLRWPGRPFRFLERTGPYEPNTVSEAASAASEWTIAPGAVMTLSTEELGHRLKFTPEDFDATR